MPLFGLNGATTGEEATLEIDIRAAAQAGYEYVELRDTKIERYLTGGGGAGRCAEYQCPGGCPPADGAGPPGAPGADAGAVRVGGGPGRALRRGCAELPASRRPARFAGARADRGRPARAGGRGSPAWRAGGV